MKSLHDDIEKKVAKFICVYCLYTSEAISMEIMPWKAKIGIDV